MNKKKGEKSNQRNNMSDEKRKIRDYIKKKKGMAKKDDRNFINGVFWILRTGVPWRDLLSDYGKWYTMHDA